MAESRSKRWQWRQTDSWHYTEPGTRKRVPLFNEQGERLRGKDNKDAARNALARIKLATFTLLGHFNRLSIST